MFIAEYLEYSSYGNRCFTTDEWIRKMWHLYTMAYYLVIKKNEIMLLEENRWNWRVLC
jgi:hypothetical protein